jgi:ERCC4-type nuclease
MKLIIDDREEILISMLSLPFEIKRLELGNFVILDSVNDNILIFERKTIKDFDKDNCYDNIIKLIQSNTTNTKSFLIIEGVNNKKIEEKILKISIKYYLPVFRTKSRDDTVFLIEQVMNSNNSKLLSVLRKMWCVFNGITVSNCDFFIKNNYKLLDVLKKNINLDDFNTDIKISFKNIDKDTEIRLLSKIPLITKECATKIMNEVDSLATLCTYNIEKIAKINSIGMKKANNIYLYLISN